MKVEILARLIQEIDPSINDRAIPKALLSAEVFQAAREADWVFGCFDEDGPRVVLNELCVAYDKPYVDLASDVISSEVYGGRVTISASGSGCLKCLDVFDPDDVRRYFSTEDQIEAIGKIYGVDKVHLAESGPSVSPFNGVVAALAATEFMVAVTGLRAPITQINYRGDHAKVMVGTNLPAADCALCATRGHGSTAEVERYLNLDHVIARRAKKTGKRA
jgi:molybdopterin/thiamine biosynthesis adenylyltransferase